MLRERFSDLRESAHRAKWCGYRRSYPRARHQTQQLPPGDAAKNQVVPAGTGNESLTTKPTLAAINQAPVTTVESSVLIARFTHLGARLRSYELKNYRRELGKPDFYEMVSQAPDGNFPLPLGVIVGGVDDASVPYTLAGVSGGEITASGNYTVPQDGSLTLRFEGVLPNGIAISKSVEFLPESYLFNVSIKLGEASPDGSNVWLAWSHLQPNLENIPSWDFVGFHTLVDGKLGHFAAKDAPEGIQELGQTKWVSYADKYFMSALMPTDEVNTAARSKRGKRYFPRPACREPDRGNLPGILWSKRLSTLKRART
jgi:YidC/Oxa1 family membrane protein insertase